jgi:hypothetical protein
MFKKFTLFLVFLFAAHSTEAQGLYTELGIGVRFTNYSSFLENPKCQKAVVINPLWPDNPRGGPNPGAFSCGGDEPMFVGDLIGWEFPRGHSIALSHKSQWFDGSGELYWTGITYNKRIYWRRFKRRD